ncbi:unnamed protein product [Durusdinium trenchii]|uniref:VWFA domain-containing protein n=1 Tax=Durusdinium trenchii TaxID=1381693 RepID=A0ABP0L2H1_9DINO
MNSMTLRCWALILALIVQPLVAMRPAVSLRADSAAYAELVQKLRQGREDCHSAIDVVFLLDGSWSVKKPDWKALKEFMTKTVQRFQIGPEKLQVGIVQFTGSAQQEMNFKSSAEEIAEGILNLEQEGGFTSVKAGLEETQELFENHHRKARRIVVMIADGDVDDGSTELAREMEEEDDTIIFSVAVGEEAKIEELKEVATNGNLFFKVENYGSLDRIVNSISKYSCEVADEAADTKKVKDIDFEALKVCLLLQYLIMLVLLRALWLAWRADGHSTIPSDKVWLFYRLALAAKTGTGVLGEFLCNSLPVQPPVRTRQRDVFPLAPLGGSMLKPVDMTSGRWSVLLQFINVVIGILNWLHGIKQTVPTGKHTFAQQAVLKNIVDRTVWTLTRLQHAQDGWERFVPDFVPGFTAGTTSFQDLVADRVDNLQAAGLCDPLPHLPAHVRASLATPEGILDNSDDSLRVFEPFSLRVWHGRRVSESASAPPKPRHLASPTALTFLECSDGRPLRLSKRDATCWFDQLKLPSSLRRYMAKPPISTVELVNAGMSVADQRQHMEDGHAWREGLLYPLHCVWPMGFSWSSYIAQEEMLSVCQDAGIPTSSLLACDCVTPTSFELVAAVATDHVMIFSDAGPGATCEAARAFDAAMDARCAVRNLKKDVDDALCGERESEAALGCTEFFGSPAFVGKESSFVATTPSESESGESAHGATSETLSHSQLDNAKSSLGTGTQTASQGTQIGTATQTASQGTQMGEQKSSVVTGAQTMSHSTQTEEQKSSLSTNTQAASQGAQIGTDTQTASQGTQIGTDTQTASQGTQIGTATGEQKSSLVTGAQTMSHSTQTEEQKSSLSTNTQTASQGTQIGTATQTASQGTQMGEQKSSVVTGAQTMSHSTQTEEQKSSLGTNTQTASQGTQMGEQKSSVGTSTQTLSHSQIDNIKSSVDTGTTQMEDDKSASLGTQTLSHSKINPESSLYSQSTDSTHTHTLSHSQIDDTRVSHSHGTETGWYGHQMSSAGQQSNSYNFPGGVQVIITPYQGAAAGTLPSTAPVPLNVAPTYTSVQTPVQEPAPYTPPETEPVEPVEEQIEYTPPKTVQTPVETEPLSPETATKPSGEVRLLLPSKAKEEEPKVVVSDFVKNAMASAYHTAQDELEAEDISQPYVPPSTPTVGAPTPTQPTANQGEALATKTHQECFIQETAKKFMPVLEGWLLLTSLSKRLMWEELGSVLATFQHYVSEKVADTVRSSLSPMTFARTLGKHLQDAVEQVNFARAQLIKAEYDDWKQLGLENYIYRVDEKQKAVLLKLKDDLCYGMVDFMEKVQAVETANPALRDPMFLWHMWQESWGAVRVFVKVTTQCRIEIPKGEDPNSFMTRIHQNKWKKCKGAFHFKEDEFPSAVMSCARSGEEDPSLFGKDRNRVVRYFGCGKNRVNVEPPVDKGVTESCMQTDDPEVKSFMYTMCPQNGISTKSCRLYGPFWGVYSHPAFSLYGYHSLEEKKECEQKRDDGAPPAEQCPEPQAVAFREQANVAMADYIYGTPPPLTISRSRAWQQGNRKVTESSWIPEDMAYPLPQDRQLDPPLWEMLREAEVGEGLMMISYGYSGAGKTTTLIGDATAPVGGGRGIDGVLSLYLKENARKIDDVQVRIFEVYGRVNAYNGRMQKKTGSGIWGYNLREKTSTYLGDSTAFEDDEGEGNLDLPKLEAALNNDEFTFSIKAQTPPSLSGSIAWHEQVKEVLTTIEDIRLDEDQFKAGGEPIAHIRGTVNNPKSSRGTLFVLTNVYFKSGVMAPISTVDLAGSEDPAVMVSGFLQFKLNPGVPECDPESGKQPSDLMNMYLATLSYYDQMAGPLAYCFDLKDVLMECDRANPARGCVDDPRGVDVPKVFEYVGENFEKKKFKARFKQETILAALEEGDVPGITELRAESNPLGAEYNWVERLWGRKMVGKGEKRKLVESGPAMMDEKVFGKKLATRDYTENGNDKPRLGLVEIPKMLLSTKTKTWHDEKSSRGLQEKTTIWKEQREKFFRAVQDYVGRYNAQEANKEFDRHLRYFASAIGPIVEEAFFINEALNDMKGYLGIWAKTSQQAPAGSILNIWPPSDFSVKGKINQVVDYSENGRIREQGYKIYDYIKPADALASYAEDLAHGKDGIMLVTMLEYIRRISVHRKRNTKVLVGTFIRSDIPGADLDCDGARASLEFAQDLSDMVGWSRGLPGVMWHLH